MKVKTEELKGVYYRMKVPKQERNWIILLLCLCILFLAALTGISGFLEHRLEIRGTTKTNETTYQKHIAMINEDSTEEFWLSIYESAREEGKKHGLYIENFGERLVEDYTAEELLEMAVAAKVDGIILNADGGDTLQDKIKKAAKAGIPVMTILSDVADSDRISFVSGSDFATGELYGNEIIDEVEKKWLKEGRMIRVSVLVDSNSERATPNLIYSGIHETTISVSDRMELSATVIDNSGKFESEETVRNLILNADAPDILVCLGAVDTISAYQSVVDYNRVGQTSIIGYYSSEDTLEGIQKGIIKSSVLINAQELGQTAAQGMSEYLEKDYVNEYLTVTPTLITEDNVKDYMEKEE